MLNSKNIHIALLGLILGSAVAYVYGSYRLEAQRQVAAEVALASAPGDAAQHPEINEEEMLAFFAEAVAANPNNSELLSRYADFLFGLQRYSEAADWFQRVLEMNPEDAAIRTAMATALYGAGSVEEAFGEFERALESDPGYALALHNLALAQLDARNDVDAASATIDRLAATNPGYPGLAPLRERLEAASAN